MSEPITARQFWIRTPGTGEIRHADLIPRRDDEVLVRASYSGVSRGTEALVFRGEVPPSQYKVMRAPFQEGEFPGPVKYGYCSVGEVLEGPENLVGSMVFCLYPHQDFYTVPARSVSRLPKGLPAERAVLAANMETALNVFWDARPMAGDRILVVGAGVIGLLVGWLCRQIPGSDVTLVDINKSRKPVAHRLGLSCLTEPPGGHDADLVIHASGEPGGLRDALNAAGIEATVVEVSWYGSRSVLLPLGEAFHSRRLTLRSSQVGRLCPDRLPRWTHDRRMKLALDLLRNSCFDALINSESDFQALPELMVRMSNEPGDILCHRIRYGRPEGALL